MECTMGRVGRILKDNDFGKNDKDNDKEDDNYDYNVRWTERHM